MRSIKLALGCSLLAALTLQSASWAAMLYAEASHADFLPPTEKHAAITRRQSDGLVPAQLQAPSASPFPEPPQNQQSQGQAQNTQLSGQALTVDDPPPVVQQDPLNDVQPTRYAAQPPVVAPQQIMLQGQTQQARTLTNPAVAWIQIPHWMTGTWSKRGDTTTYVCDLRTGTCSSPNEWVNNAMTVIWGHQRDPQGNVWHAVLLPFERDGQSDGKEVRFVTVDASCVKSDSKALLTRTHYVVTETYGRSNQIADMFQQEAFNQYLPSPRAGEFENESSNRVFTINGKPERDGRLVSTFKQVAPFKPTETMNGIDLNAAFQQFLQSRRGAMESGGIR